VFELVYQTQSLYEMYELLDHLGHAYSHKLICRIKQSLCRENR